jgi:hypothetical protein
VHDRKTPINGVRPEGVGTTPQVYVRYEPKLMQNDPILAIGIRTLREGVTWIERDKAWARLLREHPRNPLPDFTGTEDEDPEHAAQRVLGSLLDIPRTPTAEVVHKWANKYSGTRWAKTLLEYYR